MGLSVVGSVVATKVVVRLAPSARNIARAVVSSKVVGGVWAE